MRAADQVATAVARSAGIDLDGLRGANALVADHDEVTDASLDAFARGLLTESAIRVVARAQPVDDADRAAFEARVGTPIQEIAAGGTYVPAARRPSYLPVVRAVAADPAVKPVIGLDLFERPRSGGGHRSGHRARPAEDQRTARARAPRPRRATSRRRPCAPRTVGSSAT